MVGELGPPTYAAARGAGLEAGEVEVGNVQVLIDANVYLDLYSSKDLRELLTTLPTIEGLFVSRQIVDEVTRRRVPVTIEAFKQPIENVKRAALPIPEAALQSFDDETSQAINNFTESAKALNSRLTAVLEATLCRVCDGTDAVSVALAKLFRIAAEPAEVEVARARARRERGTPPGKFENPLGDQITWEQFLSRCRNGKHIFIVSRDGDFLDKWNGYLTLNPVLRDELRDVAPNAVVHVFLELSKAIPELRKVIGAAVAVPTPEKLEKAKKAEEHAAALKSERIAFSSNIAAVGYDAPSETLEIEFPNGSVYKYFNVPTVVYEQFVSAASKGQFFLANIKSAFPFSRVV